MLAVNPAVGVFAVMAAIFVAGYFGYFRFTEHGRASWKRHLQLSSAPRPSKKLSDVGVRTPAGLACPRCGGTQFQAGRKTSTKLAFGVASMLGQARHVSCVTCGAQYERG